jgi:hypothetical protein
MRARVTVNRHRQRRVWLYLNPQQRFKRFNFQHSDETIYMYTSLSHGPQRQLQLPGQYLSQSNHNVNRSSPIFVWNHTHADAVKFQYYL